MKRFIRSLALAAGLAGAQLATAAPLATIYSGNDSSFGAVANVDGSLQGFTNIEARWDALGLDTSISSVFSTAGLSLMMINHPDIAFSASQISDLQSFLAGGGLLVIAFEGGGNQANPLLGALGSSMSFVDARLGGGNQTLSVVAPGSPFMSALPDGPTLTAFAPRSVTGGTALAGLGLNAVIASESVGGGTILAIADFDMVNNVTDDFFPVAARPNNRQFQDNIACFVVGCGNNVPEPASLALFGIGVLGAVAARRRQRVPA